MIRSNLLLFLKGIVITLYTTHSTCQTAATLLANISATGGTISAPGSYYLDFDVTGEITISTSNVILDLNGNLVTGFISVANDIVDVAIMNGFITNSSSAASITANNCNNIQLSNITIRSTGSGAGIGMSSTTNVIIEEVFCYGGGNTARAIQLNTCSNAVLRKCLCRNWNTGIAILENSTDVLLEECHVANTSTGLNLDESTTPSVLNCTSFSNTNQGFFFENAGMYRVLNCIADNNKEGFITADPAAGLYMANCLAFRNTDRGFSVNSDRINIARGCVSIDNGTGFQNTAGGSDAQYANNYADANNTNYNPATVDYPFYLPVPANGKGSGRENAQFWKNTVRPSTGIATEC